MVDDKNKGIRYSAPWDTISDIEKECDSVDYAPLPAVPKDLEAKTMSAVQKAADLEVARKADHNSEEFKKRVAKFTGKPYKAPTTFEKAYNQVKDYIVDHLPWYLQW